MPRKLHIIVELLPEASILSHIVIKETVRKETKIPWSKTIEKIIIEDFNDSYKDLTNHGISSTVAKNLMQLYYFK